MARQEGKAFKGCFALEQHAANLKRDNEKLTRDKQELEKELGVGLKRSAQLLRQASAYICRQIRCIDKLKQHVKQLELKQLEQSAATSKPARAVIANSPARKGEAAQPKAAVPKPAVRVSPRLAKLGALARSTPILASTQRHEDPLDRRFRARTPDGFWDLNIPETPTTKKRAYEERQRHEVQKRKATDNAELTSQPSTKRRAAK